MKDEREDEWCCWTLSKDDIIAIASKKNIVVGIEDFDVIASKVKKGIEQAVQDVWEEIIENAIIDSLGQ